MSVTAQAVMDLRQQTGRPMMECKKALEAAQGDFQKAIEELRKAGMKAVEKLADRAANEGKIGHWRSADGKAGALVALKCETEPVTKNEMFLGFLQTLTDAIVRERPADAAALAAMRLPSGMTAEDERKELVGKIRENFTFGGFACYEADAVIQYVHFDGKKAAMVALTGKPVDEALEQLGKDLCMHVVMYRPQVMTRAEVAAADIDREKAILLESMKADPKNAKKPQEILEKIVEGQLGKFFSDRCFVEQPFIKDQAKTVAQVLKEGGVELAKFTFISTAG